MMKTSTLFLLAPLLLMTTACTSHYSAKVGHHGGYHGHHSSVSVGVHSRSHGAGNILGALIVGGVIGHILTEEAHQNDQENQHQPKTRQSSQLKNSEDELVNGYPLALKKQSQQMQQTQPEKTSEQNRFYQLGKDGNCYLMEKDKAEIQIVSLVPNYSCK